MPKSAFTPKRKAEYIKAIEDNPGRLAAAQSLDLDFSEVQRALDEDEDFRKRVELVEEVRVHDALVEAAVSGNVPAIESFMSKHPPIVAKPLAPAGALADVRRVAGRLTHLLKPSK